MCSHWDGGCALSLPWYAAQGVASACPLAPGHLQKAVCTGLPPAVLRSLVHHLLLELALQSFTCSELRVGTSSSPILLSDKKAEIDILAAEYISTVKTLSPDQRVEHLQKIQSAYSKCKEYSDDKVQLAMQTYEMVDKHIRRLDADLARFEADLKDKMEGSGFESAGGRGSKKGRSQKEKRSSRGRGRRTSEEDTPKKKKHKGGSEFTDTILSVHPSDVLDMPVDPNEPTYCLCHQVSYGEMIGCDNPDCPIEWFHFACVDLTTKPKGK
uniref:Inhibitor of growth protein N-terminal histone-binding domain-containing protein n=1 Tax=Suricata suricatta TaxID=37032 RepID=A0A673ST92_SURSU